MALVLRYESAGEREDVSRPVTMDFIMLPTQTLCNSDCPPFLLTEEAQSSGLVVIEVSFWYHFQQWLGENNVSVFILIIAVPLRIMNSR